jgi:hypothetical protein
MLLPVSGLGPITTPLFIYNKLCIYRNEIKLGKRSDTRIKPLPLTNDHGRITVTPEQALVFVGEWPLHITVMDL